MADTIIDDRTLQRLLFVTSDILAPYIETRQFIPNMCKLSVNKERNDFASLLSGNNGEFTGNQFLLKEDQVKILRRQQELFSDSTIPSAEAAHSIFKDNYTNIPIDVSYIISNYIILFIGDSPFYINIDRLNADNKKIYISKVIIKNKSKDAFTLKSNYHVTLKVNFTVFDDLLESSVVANSVVNPEVFTRIPLLKILYKFFDFPGSQAGKNLADPNGIFLIQTLTYNEGYERYSDLFSSIGTNEINKNYHLTYYKHSFEMFRNEDPFFKYFENELTIEYVAYEADGEDKPVAKELTKTFVPKVTNNLFKLLNVGPDLLPSFLQWPGNIGAELKSLRQLFENIKFANEEIEKKIKELNCVKPEDTEKKKQIQEEINQLGTNIKATKSKANKILIFCILNACQTYRIRIPYSLIGVYEVSNFSEAFKENFSLSGLLSSIGIDFLITSLGAAGTSMLAGSGVMASLGAGAAVALGPGLIAAGAAYAGYAVISALLSTKIIEQNPSLEMVRSTFSGAVRSGLVEREGNPDANFTVEVKNKFIDLAMGYKSKDKSVVGYTRPVRSLREFQEGARGENNSFKKAMEESAKLIAPDNSDPELKADIFFTTFGEIIKILTTLSGENLKIISGGYLIDTSITKGETSYCNFASLPITINSLSKFLYKFIEEIDRNLNYDSELFFRDCYENLIKAILSDGQIKLPTLKNAAPRNIKVVSTVHVNKGYESMAWLKDINILDEAEFNNFKINFLKTKNFNLAGDGLGKNAKLYKIYVLGSHDEIKYYNFYDEYNVWANNNNKENKRFNYNCDAFQEFINKKHLIPCLMMKNISDSESILKKKYVNFSRIDNPNMNTGNMLNGSGQMRYPYQFRADFKAFMSFFSDIGSLIFICPPISNFESKINMFGFGGLYIVKSAELEYSFQRIQDGKLTIPNMESRYSLDGLMISHGDSIRSLQQDLAEEEAQKEKDRCPAPVSKEPAKQGQ